MDISLRGLAGFTRNSDNSGISDTCRDTPELLRGMLHMSAPFCEAWSVPYVHWLWCRTARIPSFMMCTGTSLNNISPAPVGQSYSSATNTAAAVPQFGVAHRSFSRRGAGGRRQAPTARISDNVQEKKPVQRVGCWQAYALHCLRLYLQGFSPKYCFSAQDRELLIKEYVQTINRLCQCLLF